MEVAKFWPGLRCGQPFQAEKRSAVAEVLESCGLYPVRGFRRFSHPVRGVEKSGSHPEGGVERFPCLLREVGKSGSHPVRGVERFPHPVRGVGRRGPHPVRGVGRWRSSSSSACPPWCVDSSAGRRVWVVWVEAGSFQWRSEILLRCQKYSVPLHLTTFTY